ncbi:MAG: hypothetical protein ABI036_04780 [Fibrobacteria bacterium]
MGFGCNSETAVHVSDRQTLVRDFLAANGTNKTEDPKSLNLTFSEAWMIADSVVGATLDNQPLQSAFFRLYTSHPLKRYDPDFQSKHEAELMATMYKTTAINRRLMLGVKKMIDPYIDPDPAAKRPMQTPFALGTTALHELAHTNQAPGFGDSGSVGEAIAYGFEYFLAKRLNKTERMKEIMQIPFRLYAGASWQGHKAWANSGKSRWTFCKWYLMMKWCYENIDGKRKDLTPDEAREVVAYLVLEGRIPWLSDSSKAEKFSESELKDKHNWGEDDPESFSDLDKQIIKIRDTIAI